MLAIVIFVILFLINPALGVIAICFAGVAAFAQKAGDIKKQKRVSQLRLDALKYGVDFNGPMTGAEFEQSFAELLRRFGAGEVMVTKQSGDYGVDVVVKGGEGISVFQCKWHSRNVGVKPVQEVYAGKAHYNAKHAYVVTNSRFTKSAEALAESTGVILWDGDVLLYLIEKVRNKELVKIKEKERKKKSRKADRRKARQGFMVNTDKEMDYIEMFETVDDD